MSIVKHKDTLHLPTKGTPPLKKMFSFGHCPNEGGGEAPARIKKYNIYIYIWRPKKMYKLPERGGGGGR